MIPKTKYALKRMAYEIAAGIIGGIFIAIFIGFVAYIIVSVSSCSMNSAVVTGDTLNGQPRSGWVECDVRESCIRAAEAHCKTAVSVISWDDQVISRPYYDPAFQRWIYRNIVRVGLGFVCKIPTP